jgi:hypothetical protein
MEGELMVLSVSLHYCQLLLVTGFLERERK